jgi:nucleotide-binding universal stress UspA family protein
VVTNSLRRSGAFASAGLSVFSSQRFFSAAGSVIAFADGGPVIRASAVDALKGRAAVRRVMARLIVGFDGSAPARRAVEHAGALARTHGHEIVLVTVIPPQVRNATLATMVPAGLELPPDLSRTFEQNAQIRLDEVAAQMKSAGIQVRTEVRAGETVEALVAALSDHQGIELILGNKSFEDPSGKVGPNARQIVEKANVRVTLVP